MSREFVCFKKTAATTTPTLSGTTPVAPNRQKLPSKVRLSKSNRNLSDKENSEKE